VAEHGGRPVGVDVGEVSLADRHGFLKAAWSAGGLGLLALIAAFALGWGDGARFLGSYLFAWFTWLTLALGGLFFVLLHHLTRAGWSVVVRRLSEHVAATLPLFAILFLPIAFGAARLYPWMGGDAAGDELIAHKAGFLNPGFFFVRSGVYLVVWCGLAWWYRKRSLDQDSSGDPRITRRLQIAAAPAMVAFAVTLNFASFDWVMSLDPHWYSTIFGVYVYAGSTVSILAALALLSIALGGRRGPLAGLVTPEHLHDLGKLLFGFIVFWAYIGFSQYMLIWYGNLPEETIWFAHRLEHGWEPVTVALVLGHFVIPFFFLLSRGAKRNRIALAVAAVWMLVVHAVDVYWLVMPAVERGGFHFLWVDLLNWIAVGGLALGALGLLARRRALVPVADPRLPESLSFENM
jgi:hypothetical protein